MGAELSPEQSETLKAAATAVKEIGTLSEQVAALKKELSELRDRARAREKALRSEIAELKSMVKEVHDAAITLAERQHGIRRDVDEAVEALKLVVDRLS